MRVRSFGGLVLSGLGITLLTLVVFAVFRWLQLPTGQFLDWVIGIITFWWPVVVVRVPWDLQFAARETVADAEELQRRGLTVAAASVGYARRWARWALLLALALHAISAASFYLLAALGISPIGYLGAAAALLLTGLRPILRGYAYLASRLAAIRHEVHFPREDVRTLTTTVNELAFDLRQLQAALDVKEDNSWASQQVRALNEQRRQLQELAARCDALDSENRSAHAQLRREAEQSIAQLTVDGQFLDHVREIIRFFKSA